MTQDLKANLGKFQTLNVCFAIGPTNWVFNGQMVETQRIRVK